MLPELEDSMKKDLELLPVLCYTESQRTTAAGGMGAANELRPSTTERVMWLLLSYNQRPPNFGALRVDTLISKMLLSKLPFVL